MAENSALRSIVRAAAGLVAIAAILSAQSRIVLASVWEDATADVWGKTAEWSNKVELADLNGDGWVDVVFANGRGYSSPAGGELNRVFLNPHKRGIWNEATSAVMGSTKDQTRAIKARDFNGDGVVDLIIANTYQTQSRLLLGLGSGGFAEVTSTHLPQSLHSFGDVEVGDVDGDGDLDLVFADWGPGNPATNSGAPCRLWLNDGSGVFEDATVTHMPSVQVRWSWDLELVDIDNDYDLDIAVSCKSCSQSLIYRNDGQGVFTIVEGGVPASSNNYDFEGMHMDADEWIDLVTINDGPSLKENLLLGTNLGKFLSATAAWWGGASNEGKDDNCVRFLDYDSDGDADFVIGSLNGDDRILVNQAGKLTLLKPVLDGPVTPGTLDLGLADLDKDGRLDLVMAQGEVGDESDRVYFGTDIAPDTASPFVGVGEATWDAAPKVVRWRGRIHDRKSPAMPHDFKWLRMEVERDGEAIAELALSWYGEYLWRGQVEVDAGEDVKVRACAEDAAGNSQCGSWTQLATPTEQDEEGGEGDPDPEEDSADAESSNQRDASGEGDVADDPGPDVPEECDISPEGGEADINCDASQPQIDAVGGDAAGQTGNDGSAEDASPADTQGGSRGGRGGDAPQSDAGAQDSGDGAVDPPQGGAKDSGCGHSPQGGATAQIAPFGLIGLLGVFWLSGNWCTRRRSRRRIS